MSTAEAMRSRRRPVLLATALVTAIIVPSLLASYALAAPAPGAERPAVSSTARGTMVSPPTSSTADVDPAYSYSVTCTETGLPTGTEWFVNLTGGSSYSSTTNTVAFTEPNGTYHYSIGSANRSYASPSASFQVQGAAVPVSVSFHLVEYAVRFNEVGLPSGATWYVNLTGGTSYNSTTTFIAFAEPNGTYGYGITLVQGHWAATPSSGSVVLAGVVSPVSVTFLYAYPLVFDRPGGTPSGGSWSVSLMGSTVLTLVLVPFGAPLGIATRSTTAASLSFYEPNGSFTYWVLVKGESSYNSSGHLSVAGAGSTIVPSSISSGLPWTEYLLYGVLAAVVVVIVVVALIVLRRRKPPAPAGTSGAKDPGTAPGRGKAGKPPRGDAPASPR